MSTVFFWNVERLGGSTDDERKALLKEIYGTRVKWDIGLFCELTTKSTDPEAQNLTYRKENPYQLCYGCLDDDLDNVTLTRITPTATDAYKAAGFSGGNDFTALADRALGYACDVAGKSVYVIHAPANNDAAAKVMAFIACYLAANKTDWLVIGDFNVEPDYLKTACADLGIDIGDYIRCPLEPTYVGHPFSTSGKKYYDYVLCDFAIDLISRIWTSPRAFKSDHLPIYVTF